MNNWILPHIQEEIAEIARNRQKYKIEEAQQDQIKKPVNYVILDAALWSVDISTAFSLCSVYTSLFATRGAEQELDDVAPYLFSYADNTDFGDWLSRKEKKGLRALYISSDETLDGLRKHLRRFLRVKTGDGKWLFFRFYDPHVLMSSFPYLDEEQQFYFLLKVNYMLCNDLLPDQPCYFINGKQPVIGQEKYSVLVIDNDQLSKIGVENFRRNAIIRLQMTPNIGKSTQELISFVDKILKRALSFGFEETGIIYDYVLMNLKFEEIFRDPHLDKSINSILTNKEFTEYQKIVELKLFIDTQISQL